MYCIPPAISNSDHADEGGVYGWAEGEHVMNPHLRTTASEDSGKLIQSLGMKPVSILTWKEERI